MGKAKKDEDVTEEQSEQAFVDLQEADAEPVVPIRVEQPGESIREPALVEAVPQRDLVGSSMLGGSVEQRVDSTDQLTIGHGDFSIAIGKVRACPIRTKFDRLPIRGRGSVGRRIVTSRGS